MAMMAMMIIKMMLVLMLTMIVVVIVVILVMVQVRVAWLRMVIAKGGLASIDITILAKLHNDYLKQDGATLLTSRASVADKHTSN